MNKLIITIGCSGSGKTAWVEEHIGENKENWVVVARDQARHFLFPEFEDYKYKFTPQREKQVTEHCNKLFSTAVVMGQNIIIADTNLNPKYRSKWVKRGNRAGYEVEFKEFPMTFDALVSRNQGKNGSNISESALYKQWNMWLNYLGKKKYVPDLTKPKAIIVDIDGTIALKGNRNPYNMHKVGEDLPRKVIIDMVHHYATSNGAVMIFMSGRNETCREETQKWISDNTYFVNSMGDKLFLRGAKDQRKESIVKEEMFLTHIADNYNVVAAFESRPQVVEMWYDIGIENVICVADQRNRF